MFDDVAGFPDLSDFPLVASPCTHIPLWVVPTIVEIVLDELGIEVPVA